MRLLMALLLSLAIGCDEPHSNATPPQGQPPRNGCPEGGCPGGRCSRVKNSVLVFTAPWCSACQRDKGAVLDMQLAGVPVVTINVQDEPAIARRYGITSIPQYVLVRQGAEVSRTHDISEARSWFGGMKP